MLTDADLAEIEGRFAQSGRTVPALTLSEDAP